MNHFATFLGRIDAFATKFTPLAIGFAASAAMGQVPLKEPRFELVSTGNFQASLELSSAGDVDADGFDDVIVGFPYDPANNWRGSVRIYSGRDGAELFHLVGNTTYERPGSSVARAGDMNRDGYDDVILGVPGRLDQMGSDGGAVLVLSGGQLIPQRWVVASQLLSTRITQCRNLGLRVAGLGDITGDGYPDFMASAYLYDSAHVSPYGGVFVLSGSDGSVIDVLDDTSSTTPSQGFGSTISGCGDVDGDGVNDLLVGDASYQGNEGAVFVYSGATRGLIWAIHGGTSEHLGSLVSDAGDVDGDGLHEFMAFRYFGGGVLYSFATRQALMSLPGNRGGGVGDVDGDGRDDFIVGNTNAGYSGNGYAGAAYVISGATRQSIYTFVGRSESSEWLGAGACSAGDVNGDGFGDFMFTATDSGGGSLRATRIFLGGPHAIGRFRVDGDSGSDYLGRSVSGVGDVNGDGFDDVVVGAYGDDNNGADSGSIRVLSGSDGATLHAVDGDTPGDLFGIATSGAGDVNGDGHADVIVGAHAHAGGSGMARVISGADGTALHSFYGAMPLDRLGYAVSGVGDIDGDGYDDVLVGAYGDDTIASDAGAATVYSGRDGTPIPGRTFHGAATNDYFGVALRGAGDVNRDGVPDFIIGAYGHDTATLTDAGLARVISGRDGTTLYDFEGQVANERFGRSVSGAGDVDGDGYADLIVGSFAASAQVARVYSGRTGLLIYSFPHTSGSPLTVAGAGDVNGDGYDDVMVGVTYPWGSGRGIVRVHSGFDGGVLVQQFAENTHNGDGYGISIGSAGDTDGDGFDEVVVGAYLSNVNGTASGSAFVYGFDQHRSTVLRPGVRRTYGAACVGGNQRLPRIGAFDRPAIGERFAVTLHGGPNAPSNAILFIGGEASISLAALGMPDCTLLVSSLIQETTTTDSVGMATAVVPIPSDNALLGVQLGMQWIVLDAAAPRALPLSLSDGLRAILGR